MYLKQSVRAAAAVLACALTLSLSSYAEVSAGSRTARPLITQKIDESKLVTREGNVSPLARIAKDDRGAAADSLRMDGIELLMKRSPEQEAAFAKLMDQLHTPGNPNYHKWLTQAQINENFGLNHADVEAASAWLQSHGFKVTGIDPAGMFIVFNGTAGQVRETFHTEIHNFEVNGEIRFANVSEPQIPAALANAVVGPVQLHNFPLAMQYKLVHPVHFNSEGKAIPYAKGNVGKPTPEFTSTNTDFPYPIVPGDARTIYNVNPLVAAGYTGKGSTIGLIEDGNDYKDADYAAFVGQFFPGGLYGASSANLSTAHPAGSATCTNPGTVVGTDGEVELDIEYATAMAPAAKVIIESCADSTTYGTVYAAQNLASATTPPAIISMSYGIGETGSTATTNAAYNTAFQTLASKGTSVFVSTGDQGPTTDDRSPAYGRHGNMPSGWSDSPYVTAVGGTDFYDGAQGTFSTYWNTTNAADFSSAKGYIPEIPWNDTCASSVLLALEGFTTAYGAAGTTTGFCNTTTAANEGLQTDTAGSGGASNCYSGAASSGVAGSGTCAGLAKPSYQTVFGNPADGVRDQPDVSLFASNGFYGHYITICYSQPASGAGGAACTSGPYVAGTSTDPATWTGIGGTSGSSPMMAGIQALIDQYVGTTTNGVGALQGAANYVYYNLAAQEYGASGSTTCNSNNVPLTGSTCAFYDVTSGDIEVACKGLKVGTVTTLHGCYDPAGAFGVSSTSTTAYAPAFNSTVGWDFTTGIGTVNAYNLATNWRNAFPTTTAVTLGSNANSGNANDVLTATVSAATKDNALSGGTQIAIIGGITFYDGATQIGACTITTGAACSYTATGSQLQPGSNSITAVYAGNNAYPGSTSPAVNIAETDATSTSASANPTTIAYNGSTQVSATVSNTTLSSAVPTGSVAFTVGSTSLGSCTLTAGTCAVTVNASSLATGSNTITASYAGVTGSFAASSNTTTVTVNAKPADNTSTSPSANPSTILTTQTTVLSATVVDTGVGSVTAPRKPVAQVSAGVTGTVKFNLGTAGGTLLGSCTLLGGTCSTSAIAGTSFAVGSNTVVASYQGVAGVYNTSSGTTTVTVNQPVTNVLTFSSVGHNMGSVPAGSSTSGTSNYGVKVTNSSTTLAYTGFTVSFGGSNPSSFSQTNNCPASIAAGASCEIVFAFAPATTGSFSATWSVSGTTNGFSYSPSNGGTLTGTGTTSGTGGVTLTTGGHNFGTVTDGTTSPVYGTVLTNSTSSAVTLSFTTVTSPFHVTLNNCPATLAANASCNLQFDFAPTAPGITSQTFGISVNGGSTPITTGGVTVTGVKLTGTGQ